MYEQCCIALLGGTARLRFDQLAEYNPGEAIISGTRIAPEEIFAKWSEIRLFLQSRSIGRDFGDIFKFSL